MREWARVRARYYLFGGQRGVPKSWDNPTAMAKNFRKTYYKTLGVPVVQEVDVQTSFCTLLSENVIDINQLIRVTLKYGCPAMYRKVVWEIV